MDFRAWVAKGVRVAGGLGLALWSGLALATTTINEQFTPATIDPGDTSAYRITIANTSLVALDQAKVTVLLPAPVLIASPASIANTCGFTVNAATPGTSTVELVGGTIPAGNGTVDGQCYFQLNVTSATANNHVATIPANITPDAATAGYTAKENGVDVWNSTVANATLSVNSLQNPTGSKTFSPSPAIAGDPTTLTVTLSNPNAAATIPLTTFTDTFPDDGSGHGMVVASPASPTINCTGTGASNGTVTATPGANSITLTGGTIGKGGSCTLTAKVIVPTIGNAATSQNFNNSLASGAIGNIRGLTSPAFNKSLTVNSPIAVSKSFGTATIPSGQASLMTLAITNNSTTNALDITSFADDLTGTTIKVLNTASAPVAAAADPAVVCSGTGAVNGSLNYTADTLNTSLTLTGAKAGPKSGSNGKCVITAYVTSNTDGGHANTIAANAVVNPVGHPSPTASDTLTTNAQLTVDKTVSVANVAPGQWTEFTITVSNWSGADVTNVSFLDILPKSGANQMVAFDNGSGVYSADAGCTGGTWEGTNASGTGTGSAPVSGTDAGVKWTGGTIVAGSGASAGVCTIKIRGKLPASATTGLSFSNQIPIWDGTHGIGGSGNGPGGNVVNTAASPAANVTSVDAVSVIKSFSPTSIAQGGSSTLTIKVRNRVVNALTAVNLTDNLPSGVTLAANPAATNGCGGTLQAWPGDTKLILSGGTIAARPAGSEYTECQITAKVTGTATGSYTNTIHPADFSSSGGTIPSNATANLTINTGLSGSKTFTPTKVTSGGVATVKITVSNSSSSQLTNVSVNDNGFSGGLAIANPANASTNCPGSPTLVANPGATSAQLLGATLASGASCDVFFDVVSSGAGPWSNNIAIGNITSAEGPSNTAAVSANLAVQSAQININKSFNPVIVTGGVKSVLQIDVINPSSIAMHGVGFTDTFPNGIEVYSVPGTSTDCTGGIVTAVPGTNSISLAGATVAANATCHVYVNTTSVKFLNLTNTIPASSIVSDEGYTNATGTSASLSTLQGLGIMKGFSPAYIGPGQTSTLQMKLVSTFDPNAPTPITLTGVSYTDTLPAGLVVATPANASTTCTSGTVTAAAGSGLITLSGANLSPGTTCTVTVNVTAPALGGYDNTIPANSVTTDQGIPNQDPATASLYVVTSPTLAKAFQNAARNPGQANRLTVTISNNDTAIALTGVALTDTLPAGLAIASAPNASTTCSGGTVTANAGASSFSIAGASIPAGGSCTFRADVVGYTAGSYTNNINASALTTNEGLTNPGAVNASMTVAEAPTVAKAFNPTSIATNGISTLTLSLGNANASAITLSSAFVDALPGNVVVAAVPNIGGTCTVGSVTAAAGSSSITYANGASIPAGGCTITVDVTSAIDGVYTNTLAAGQLATSAGSNQLPATAGIAVGAGALVPPTVAKSFSPTSIAAGGISTLTIALGNANASPLTLSADLVDNLPANVVVAAAPNIGGTCATGSVTAAAGTGTITYANGAAIAASGGCTITVDVTSSVGGSYTNTIAAGAVQTNGGNNASPATAGLVVQTAIPPTVTKAFSPSTINPGATSTLTISLGNGNAAAISLASVLTDTLPPGVGVAATPNIGGTCTTGSVTAAAGGGTISYAGGATIPSGGCTIKVDVTAASSAGSPYTNTIAANDLQTGSGNNGAPATAKLFVNPPQPPSISKSFSPATIGQSGTSTLTLSFGNGNLSTATLTSDLVDTLPANLVIAAAPNIQQSGGCSLGKFVATAGTGSVTYQTGGVIPAGGCTVTVAVTSDTAGTYTNTIAAAALKTDVGNNAVSTTSTLTVNPLPTVAKAFSPATVLEGGTSTLTITLGNASGSAITLTSAFTDTLPAGVVVAGTPAIGGTCATGSVTAAAGAGAVTYANGASVAAGGCTITVAVTAATTGSYVNTIAAGALQTSLGNNPLAATATLNVNALPTLAKAFSPASIPENGTSTLTLTLGNTNASSLTLTSPLTDNLPSGVKVAAAPAIGGTCAAGSVTAAAGGTSITYANGAGIASGGCTISVAVTAGTAGSYLNTIAAGALKTNVGNSPSAATDTLTVTNLPTINKAFSPASVYEGATSTLTLTLGNPGAAAVTLTSALVDTLPSGLTLAAAPSVGGTCTAGSVTAASGGGSITYAAGAGIPSGGCTITALVTSATPAVYTNTIPAGGLATSVGSNIAQATADLTVTKLPTIAKSFTPSTIIEGGTSTLTLSIVNPRAVAISLTADLVDSLPTGVVVAGTPAVGGTCTAGSVTAVAGASTVTYANAASVPAGGCDITVAVTAAAHGTYLNTLPAGALKTNIGNNAVPATATLQVNALPTVAKAFSPASVPAGGTAPSTLTLTLGNANAAALTLTADFVDTLPAGVSIAPTPAVGGTCTAGSVTAAAGGGSVTYANGAGIPSGGCTISVNVVAPAEGSYVNTVAAGDLKTDVGDNPSPATATLTVDRPTSGTPAAGGGSVAPIPDTPSTCGVTGHIFLDSNGNGVQEAGESGLGGILVRVQASDGSITNVTTDASGNWSAVTAAGSVTATPSLPAGSTVSTGGDGSRTATVSSGPTCSSTAPVGVKPASAATQKLTCQVYYDLNANGVRDAGESGFAGASVAIVAGGTALSATTDAAGTCSVDVPAGAAAMQVSAVGGYVVTTGNASQTVVVPSGQSAAATAVGLTLPGSGSSTLTGTVYLDTNKDGKLDGGETVLAGVAIVITGPGWTRTVTTDSEGHYTVTIPPGSYTATVVVPAGYGIGPSGGGTQSMSIALNDDALTEAVGLVVPDPATVNGVVWCDANGNGVHDSGEFGAGAGLSVTVTNGATQQAATDAAGKWSASVAGGEIASVLLATPSWGKITSTNPVSVNVPVGGTVNVEHGVQAASGNFSGFVFLDHDLNGVYTAGFDVPLTGAMVEITDSTGAVQTVATNHLGRYTATVPAGTAQVRPLAVAGYNASAAQSVNVSGCGPTTVADLFQQIADTSCFGGVSGHIYVDLNGNGLEDSGEPALGNATVSLKTPAGGTIAVSTDAYGNFGAAVPAGTTVVAITPPAGYAGPTLAGVAQQDIPVACGIIAPIKVVPVPDPTPGTPDIPDVGTTPPTLGILADLRVAKTVNTAQAKIGDSVRFTVTLSNRGPGSPSAVVVRDLIPGGMDVVKATADRGSYDAGSGLWQVGGIQNGESLKLIVDASLHAAGALTNTAQVWQSDLFDPTSTPGNSVEAEDDQDSATVAAQGIGSADLSLVKTADRTRALVGGPVAFTLTVTNHGPDVSHGVRVADYWPSGFGFVSVDPGKGSIDAVHGQWVIDTLAVGESASLTLHATMFEGGDHENVAEIVGASTVDPDSTPGNHVPGEDDQGSVTVLPQTGLADLSLTKTADRAGAAVGEVVNFVVTVTNHGPDVAKDIRVGDRWPDGFAFVSADQDKGSLDYATGQWVLSSLGVGESANIVLRGTMLAKGSHVNIAEIVDSATADPDSSPGNWNPSEDDYGVAEVLPMEVADLRLAKLASATTVAVGDSVNFTVTVTNDGPGVARDIHIVDHWPSGIRFAAAKAGKGVVNPSGGEAPMGEWVIDSLAAGESAQLTLTGTVLPQGDYRNVAEIQSAVAKDPDSSPGNHSPGEDDQAASSIQPVGGSGLTQPIPTLPEWGLILLATLMALMAWPAVARRRGGR